jgi:hypothetical protein
LHYLIVYPNFTLCGVSDWIYHTGEAWLFDDQLIDCDDVEENIRRGCVKLNREVEGLQSPLAAFEVEALKQ